MPKGDNCWEHDKSTVRLLWRTMEPRLRCVGLQIDQLLRLQQLGWRQVSNIRLVYRWAGSNLDRLPRLAPVGSCRGAWRHRHRVACVGFPGSKIAATRVRPGAVSLSSSSDLAAIVFSGVANPVMLPPGSARLVTKPILTGSEICANTISIELVSRGSATVACTPIVLAPSAARATRKAMPPLPRRVA